MIQKLFLVVLFWLACSVSFAQNDVNTLRDDARKSMVSGDLTTAVTLLTKAVELDKSNIEIKKDLTLAYYYNKDYKKALSIIEPIMNSDDGDVACYQLTGTVYKAMNDVKNAEKVYQQAIKIFPRSGPLYSEYGDLLDMAKRPNEAIAIWEKGMQVAPSYSGNYYNAAIYYYKSPMNKIFAILYGEIYANMESLNPKTQTIKKMILDAYKDLFAGVNLANAVKDAKNEFAKAVLQTYTKQNSTNLAVTPETLGMIRTRFILDWNNDYATQFPFKLFDFLTQLLKDGLYESYNQWMFGVVDNEDAFKNWVSLHQEAYDKFTQFHSSRIFKMPSGQVYSAK
jgi:tetratricopeptide (TPR) repeat protein